MTTEALQRVVVRMLHDPLLVDALYSGDDNALADAPLSETERRWLVQPDRRAWATDPLRRTRGLQALLEELPAAAAMRLHQGGTFAELDSFFSGPAFHQAIQSGASLAATFASWLAERGPEVAALAALEGGVARARRRHDGPWLVPGPEQLVVAAHAYPLTLPGGTLALYGAIVGQLGTTGPGAADRLAADDFTLAQLPLLSQPEEPTLIEVSAEGVGVSGASDALVALLSAALQPTLRTAVLAIARAWGCDPGEDAEVVDDLIADGLLAA